MSFVVGGCRYPKNYRWISQPLSMSPHGGLWKSYPKYYQDYDEYLKWKREEAERKWREERDANFKEFFKRFFGGFYGFDEEEDKSKLEPDYPYSVFGLKKSASNEDMKKAYRKSVLKAHPDKGGSAEAFRKIQEAWNYFKNNYF